MGTGTNEPVPTDVAEAEIRHRLYVAVTRTTEHLMHLPAAESVPLALQTVPGIAPGTEPGAKAGDPCPTCGAAMVQMQGGVECISDHK